MSQKRGFDCWFRASVLGGIVVSFVLPWSARAADLPESIAPPLKAGVKSEAAPTILTMADCIQIAHDKHPRIHAASASLASAQAQAQALDNLHRGPMTKDLCIRREQSSLGVDAAQAALVQTELDVEYAVKRTYFTVIYARMQKKVTDDVVGNLKFYQERVKEAVDKGTGKKEWTTNTVDKITIYYRMAESKQIEAAHGIERAMAALREAMGVGCELCFEVPYDQLPITKVTISKCDIIAMALSNRGELVQADNLAAITNLEKDAQCKHCMPGLIPTFAAGADIHSGVVPQGIANGEYRPGGIPPEMPTHIAGKRNDRCKRASALGGKAFAVSDEAHNLVALEAEDAYLKWEDAYQRSQKNRDAAESGLRLAKNTQDDFKGDQKESVVDVLTNEVLAGQARGAYNESLFQYLIALAALERITGGAFHVVYERPAAPK